MNTGHFSCLFCLFVCPKRQPKFMRLIFHFWFFGPLLAGKWAWQPRGPLVTWDLKTQPKNWSTGWTFWANCYLDKLFSKFSGLNHADSYLKDEWFWKQSLIILLNVFMTNLVNGICFSYLYHYLGLFQSSINPVLKLILKITSSGMLQLAQSEPWLLLQLILIILGFYDWH